MAFMVLTGLIAASGAESRAGDWPGWRGPTGSGTTGEKNLPLKWDGKTGEGVLWKAPLKGTTGHSSPIVWGDRVFITTAVQQTRQEEEAKAIPDHHFACYQAADGKLLWQTRVAHGPHQEGYNIYAVPTPVTDGNVVYSWFGSAVMAAVDVQGKLLWRKERGGEYKLNPGICSSPVLCGDTVIVLCDQGGGNGWLEAVDKKTGEVKWRQKRDKFIYNNTTPLVVRVNGKDQLIVAGGNYGPAWLQGLNPASGEPIWRCSANAFGASPVFASGLVLSEAPKETMLAVAAGGEGDITKTLVKWQSAKIKSPYSSAVVCGNYVYRVHDQGIVRCWDFTSGKDLFTERLENLSHLASPIATADGRIYYVSTGKSYVLRAGPKLEVIGGGNLGGGGNGSSPAVSNGRIFVRDFDFLYCLANTPPRPANGQTR
jgi:outer membrane protein assembly factor BamB